MLLTKKKKSVKQKSDVLRFTLILQFYYGNFHKEIVKNMNKWK